MSVAAEASVNGPAVGQALLLFEQECFRVKLLHTLARVTAALRHGDRPYVALSGGKDSLVVMALVERVRPGTTLLWSDDELECPETVAYMELMQRLAGDQLVTARGWAQHAGWFHPWRDRPFWREPLPGTVAAGMEADDWMARRGHDLTFLGTRARESRKRRNWLVGVRAIHGEPGVYPVARGTGQRCCPIWDWTEDEVWALIAGWRLPYNAAYDRLAEIGVSRERQRIGPLPLTPRAILAEGWPDLLARLEARYGQRWG